MNKQLADIYFKEKPFSLLQAALEINGSFENVMVLHSLSKRSNIPGFRSGCATGDHKIISAYSKYRMFHGVSVPLPIQKASILAWEDDETVKTFTELTQNVYIKDILERIGDTGEFYIPN